MYVKITQNFKKTDFLLVSTQHSNLNEFLCTEKEKKYYFYVWNLQKHLLSTFELLSSSSRFQYVFTFFDFKFLEFGCFMAQEQCVAVKWTKPVPSQDAGCFFVVIITACLLKLVQQCSETNFCFVTKSVGDQNFIVYFF